jgi:hypothetical protein
VIDAMRSLINGKIKKNIENALHILSTATLPWKQNLLLPNNTEIRLTAEIGFEKLFLVLVSRVHSVIILKVTSTQFYLWMWSV